MQRSLATLGAPQRSGASLTSQLAASSSSPARPLSSSSRMLSVQALVQAAAASTGADQAPSHNVAGALLALALVYASLRRVCNVDRLLSKLFPGLVLAGAYYRYLLLLEAEAPARSVLRAVWDAVGEQVPLAEAVVGDTIGAVALLLALGYVVDTLRKLRYVSRKRVLNVVGGSVVSVMRTLPVISGRVASEIKKIERDIEHSLHKAQDDQEELSAEPSPAGKLRALPAKGMDDQALVALMEKLAGDSDKRWQDGLVSGAVYHGEKSHLDVLNKAYALFSVSNPLHADIWPAVNKFEAEVIAMTASLVNGGDTNVCGTLSSGGTESIFLATKTHREYYRRVHGITSPEIIACVTAHAAIDKACEILGIKLIKVPMNHKTMQADVDAVRWNLTANTIMIYASAPNFPHGIIDDIEELSKIAKQNDVGLHVDCCLGGFILPFAKQLRKLPKFDFALPGVTSMSCDTHKYGYAAKGTSVVLYRNQELRRHQYFAYPDWTGGLYVTPTLAGSRPGALSAAAWASMVRLGYEGFMKTTAAILETADVIKAGIPKIPGLKLVGDPLVMVVCFRGDGVNVLKVSDAMAKKGWSLNPLQHPTSVHLCVTVRQIGRGEKFLKELAESVEEVRSDPNSRHEGGSAIYGMASSLPAGPVDDILRIYTDVSLKV